MKQCFLLVFIGSTVRSDLDLLTLLSYIYIRPSTPGSISLFQKWLDHAVQYSMTYCVFTFLY